MRCFKIDFDYVVHGVFRFFCSLFVVMATPVRLMFMLLVLYNLVLCIYQ